MASLCNICCEPYNKSTRQEISCMFKECDFKCCKTCIRTYLLSNSEPKCMKCDKIWNLNFLVMNLNRSFVTNDYSSHNKQNLLEREISKLPDSMNDVEYTKSKLNEAEKIDGDCKTLQLDIDKYNNQIQELLNLQKPIRDKKYKLLLNKKMCEREAFNFTNKKIEEKEKKAFIMPCPVEKCRGFLSKSYKCGICSTHTCPKCFDIIGKNKNDQHTCNEDNIKTAELIKKETKPCPSCGTRISKIDGCDQMWCIECHQAFSWKTGLADTGVVHNPHFYEFQRNNNGTVARAPGDVLCGGLCGWNHLQSRVINKITAATIKQNSSVLVRVFDTTSRRTMIRTGKIIDFSKEVNKYLVKYLNSNNERVDDYFSKKDIIVGTKTRITYLHQFVTHITHLSLNETLGIINEKSDENITKVLRVKYLLNQITKEELSAFTYNIQNTIKKNTELLHIYQLLNVVGIETFANLVNSDLEGEHFVLEVEKQLETYSKLCNYCNEQFAGISVSYNCVAMEINNDFKINTKKASIREIKKYNNNNNNSKAAAEESDN